MKSKDLQEIIEVHTKYAKSDNDIDFLAEIDYVEALTDNSEALLNKAESILLHSQSENLKCLILDIYSKDINKDIIPTLIVLLKEENSDYVENNILYCLSFYDCSIYLIDIIKLIYKLKTANELMFLCVCIVKEMKGPFDLEDIKKSIDIVNKKCVSIEYKYFKSMQIFIADTLIYLTRFYKETILLLN